ncbi:D-alanine--D-alanine ligase family protein [Kutzneria sp. CA-103260]|uniref:D-alanine--D-alanine ligase family protein n=1 Tax=Kutzneria sp. CA-103260 TaxID=2802641 RepID=UPI001BAB4F5D|nr:D-alanine--D-alanine ligase [Kutzneria sp. CA-103260]QUQ65418.1 D-alanyl-alanine synthetase A [Kutzneria sp. CA-103260]
MIELSRLAIAIVAGGRSRERPRSLLSGRTVTASLVKQGFDVQLVDTEQSDFPATVARKDVAFLTLAGKWGEDGHCQGYLETLGIPYTGSGVLASALCMDKKLAKIVLSAAGLKVLPDRVIGGGVDIGQLAEEVRTEFGFPVILKPLAEGGSIDIMVATREAELRDAMVAVGADRGEFLVEPFMGSRSFTVGNIACEDGVLTLPPLEIEPKVQFYDYSAKRNEDLYTYHCPARLDEELTAQLRNMARAAHETAGCHGLSRVDFVLGPAGPAILEINTLPGLSAGGNMATMASVAGIGYDELVRLILNTAFTRELSPSTASV